MKIIYASDIHEAYGTLGKLFRETEADLYIIAGDLLYNAFGSLEQATRFTELQQFMRSWCLSRAIGCGHGAAAREIIASPSAQDSERQAAQEFLRMTDIARRTMLRKYARLADIFSASGKPCIITIPGNYDMDLSLTALSPWDLHRKSMALGGVKISGYGGAPVFTPGIPEDLQVKFREEPGGNPHSSEPYCFFSREQPDIIVVHHPAYGYLDRLASYGSIGSIGMRDFVDHGSVRVVLSGHMHEDWGALFRDGRVFINPSNFGRFVEIQRVKRGGHFVEFFIEGKEFRGGMLRQLEAGKIYDVEQCVLRGGKFRLQVADLKRYRSLANIRKREKHIRAIRLFNRLRGFFQKYETQESRKRVEALVQLCEALEREGHEVAFHLLGSLNFGMAEETSDVDAVLYFRDDALRAPDDVSCPAPDYVQEKIEALKAGGVVVSICDCLNFAGIEEAIRREDVESLQLQRFIFYDSTCRCVNSRMIREVEHLFAKNDWLRAVVEQELAQYFRMLISSFRHAYSFKKYQERLRDKGMTVPPYIEELIWQYLQRTEKGRKWGHP